MNTITKTIYVADDGTEFETEEKCLRYENAKEISNILMYDRDYNRIYDFGESYFVLINTPEQIKILNDYCEEEGFISPYRYLSTNKRGVLMFKDGKGWYHIDSIIDELQEIKHEVMSQAYNT